MTDEKVIALDEARAKRAEPSGNQPTIKLGYSEHGFEIRIEGDGINDADRLTYGTLLLRSSIAYLMDISERPGMEEAAPISAAVLFGSGAGTVDLSRRVLADPEWMGRVATSYQTIAAEIEGRIKPPPANG